MPKQNRLPTYMGVLAQPQMSLAPYTDPVVQRLFPDKVREVIGQDSGAFLDRLLALYSHYRVDPKGPASAWDLLQALAMVHEPGKPYSELMVMHGVDPTDTLAPFRLAMKLAHDHVPEFKYEVRR